MMGLISFESRGCVAVRHSQSHQFRHPQVIHTLREVIVPKRLRIVPLGVVARYTCGLQCANDVGSEVM
jgi:hypothetical protein